MAAVGRISGPLLKANLERQGVDLAFETDLLYLDVNNSRIGINNGTPQYDLDVNGTTRTTNLEVTTLSQLADITVSGNTISTASGVLNLATADTVVYQNKLSIDSLNIYDNVIETVDSNANLELRANGTGLVQIPSNDVEIAQDLTVGGITTLQSLVANGTITAQAFYNNDILIDDNFITTTTSNSNLELRADGTGVIYVPSNDVLIDQNLTVNGITTLSDANVTGTVTHVGNLNQTGNIDVTGSVTISNNLIVNNAAQFENIKIDQNVISTTVSNSNLELRPSGTGTVDIYNDTTVYGNIHATGNISADGNIQIGNEDTDSVTFNAEIASNIIPDADNTYILGSETKRWANIWVDTFIADNIDTGALVVDGIDLALRQGNIIYVAENGDTTNTGTHPNDPKSSIKEAVQLATAGTTVFVYPGVYTEEFPIEIPAGVTLKGAGIRSVKMIPTVATQNNDAFLLNGETTIEDLTVADFYSPGYAFKYAPGMVVSSRSPYIRNISVITQGSITTTSDPRGFDAGDAGKGAYLDGSVVAVNSKEASCLFHSVTFITPGVDAIEATNGVRIEWLNSFTYFANRSIYAYDGIDGLKGIGKTALRVDGVVGTYLAGETVTYYDTDGTTVLASATIDSVDADGKIYLDGKQTGFVTADSRGGKTLTANGDAQLSTAVKKFGTASLLLDGTGDYVSIASQDDFGFGTNNFTLEAWIYKTADTGQESIFDFRTQASDNAVAIGVRNANKPYVYVNGAYRIDSATELTLSAWNHIAYVREGTTGTLYLNGTSVGSWTDNTDYGITKPLIIGAGYTGGFTYWTGNIDDLRIINGIAEYTGNFTPSTSRLSVTPETVLMARFDGTNGSTLFEDDVVYNQDVRFSGGATATKIILADFTDFGAEIRSIASASVYGNYGIYGDGPGVIMYLISQNLAYIGTGKSVDNDPLLVIQANEITELNDAKIRYTSVDHKGDFRVGDLFYVNQADGTVEFTTAEFNIASGSGLTFTNNGDITFIDGSKIETGNIRISGNTVESLSGDLNISSASNEINFENDVNINGDLDVTGNVTIGGNITIGDESTDSINIVAGINSDLIPRDSATYNLGSPTNEWNKLFVSEIDIDSIRINTNVIETVESNADLELQANGTGRIYVPTNDVQLDQNLTVNGTTTLSTTIINGSVSINGLITQVGNFDITGNISISDRLFVSSQAQFENILIDDNFITTTASNSDLELRASGTGKILIPSNDVSVESNFYVSGIAYLNDINSTGTITANSFSTGDILIDDNFITTTLSNSNLELRTNGTGAVIIDNFSFNSNIISTDTDMILQSSTGVVRISGSSSLRVPVGTELERPASPELGMIRFNTTDNTFEGYDGNWRALSRGVIDLDRNTYITAELTPGANDNVIRFYSNNQLVADIDLSRFRTDKLIVDDIQIDGNVISTINSNADLELRPNGTGAVVTDNFSIKNNTITNTVPDSITNFISTNNGYFKFAGNNGLVLPVGGNLDRPLPQFTETGMTRFNVDDDRLEIFDGTDWVSVAGSSGAISAGDAEELAVGYVLVLG